MIKQTVKYEDFEGNTVEKDFWFHLSKADIAELQFAGEDSALATMLEKLGDEDVSAKQALAIFKQIVEHAVGERSEDGVRFVKNDDIRNAFMQTDAYSELLFSMLEDPKKAVSFINNLMPKSIREEIKKSYDGKDLSEMSEEELRQALAKAQNK